MPKSEATVNLGMFYLMTVGGCAAALYLIYFGVPL